MAQGPFTFGINGGVWETAAIIRQICGIVNSDHKALRVISSAEHVGRSAKFVIWGKSRISCRRRTEQLQRFKAMLEPLLSPFSAI